MRKLILIAVIVTMSTSTCYANLSLASNDPIPAATDQPKSHAPEARSATVAKSPSIPRPRRHSSGNAFSFRGFRQHCL
jgi:hypothetical protein